ncbi:putative GTPase inhibitor [Papiliotrema laurentii]|uniref:GTPase inhibitor n=1 Tax=Papiliotrema laurentii TaxID=5418 RepID=A0AAD9FND4_PAPLA|nr:putative GTPase inhibitor [Papiliotrema laurentii]
MSAPPSPTLSDSALLDSLDDDPRFDLAANREKRMEEIKEEVEKVKRLRETEYGRVVTYGEEKKLIERMAKEKYCVIHFFHPDFTRCRIMDKHLDELAPKYPHTLFLRASVADVPFLVNKFGVQVLPCVHVFVDGKGVDRLIGFEELGHTDQFTTSALEFRLRQTGALPSGPIVLANTLSSALTGREQGDSDTDSESDDELQARRKASSAVRAGARRGKTGIRDGLVGAGSDDDF